HNVASSLTTNLVCSRFNMASSISCCTLSGFLGSRWLLVDLQFQNAAHFFRQLFHAERFGNMRHVVSFQELTRLRCNNVASHEKEPLSQGVSGTFQEFIEMLPVEAGHLHVADDQIEIVLRRALQGFAAVQQHFRLHALVLQYVGDQARHGWLILYDEHSRAFSGFTRVRSMAILMCPGWRGRGQKILPLGERKLRGLVLKRSAGRGEFDLKYCSSR